MSQPSPLSPARQRAQALADSGDLVGAIALLERAVALGKINLAEDDPDVLRTAYQLGRLLQRDDDPMGARRVLEDAYAAGLWRLGDSDPLMLKISHDIGVVAQELGNRHEARKAFTRVAELGPATLGEGHEAVARARAYLGQDQDASVRGQAPLQPQPAPSQAQSSGAAAFPAQQSSGPPTSAPPVQPQYPASATPVQYPASTRPVQPQPTNAPPAQPLYPGSAPPAQPQRPASAPPPQPQYPASAPPAYPASAPPAQPQRPTSAPPVQPQYPGSAPLVEPRHPSSAPPAPPTHPPVQSDPNYGEEPTTPMPARNAGSALDEPTATLPAVTRSSGPELVQPPTPANQQVWSAQRADTPRTPPGEDTRQAWAEEGQPQQYFQQTLPPGQWGQVTPPAAEQNPYHQIAEPRPQAYPKRGLGLFAAIAAVLAAVIAVAALVYVLANRAGDGNDSNVPTLAGNPPTDVRLRDEGSRIVVTWKDPTTGSVSFLVAMAHPGEQLKPVGTLGPGTTSFVMSALSTDLNYCFAVVAVYRDNKFATSEQACTDRPAPTTAPK